MTRLWIYRPFTLAVTLILGLAGPPVWAQEGDFHYSTNNGAITIDLYVGTNGAVVVPATITGLPVTEIAKAAFYRIATITSITIANSVTNIGEGAFFGCAGLANVVLPNNLSTIEPSLFWGCRSLPTITIPASVTYIGDAAFAGTTNLSSVFFEGNAPDTGSSLFVLGSNPVIYFEPGTSGWGSDFAGQPTAPVTTSPLKLILSPASQIMTNGFSFTISSSASTNGPVVVEATTDLKVPAWLPVSTNTLVNGAAFFNDPAWTNSPIRFYRARTL